MGTKSTEAKTRYNTKTYDTISIRQPKGWRDKVKDAADKAGKSLAGYIRDAVDKEMGGSTSWAHGKASTDTAQNQAAQIIKRY